MAKSFDNVNSLLSSHANASIEKLSEVKESILRVVRDKLSNLKDVLTIAVEEKVKIVNSQSTEVLKHSIKDLHDDNVVLAKRLDSLYVYFNESPLKAIQDLQEQLDSLKELMSDYNKRNDAQVPNMNTLSLFDEIASVNHANITIQSKQKASTPNVSTTIDTVFRLGTKWSTQDWDFHINKIKNNHDSSSKSRHQKSSRRWAKWSRRLLTVSDNVNIPKGGGVLIALKNIFNASEVNLSQFPSLEVVAIKIRFAKKSLFFICCYIPPNSSCETYHNLVEAVDYISSLANAEDDLIICGDFNLPHILWKSVDEENYMTPAYISSIAEATLIDGFNSYDLQQISNTFNSSGRMLDLIFTSDWVNAFHYPIFTLLTKIDNYHPPIGFIYNYDSPINSQPNISFGYNFSRADFVGLNNYFFTVDFETLLCNVPIDEAVKKFYDVVLHGFDMYVPKTRNKSIDSSPVWFSIELKKLRNKKNKAWRKYVKTQSSESYSTFINLFYSFKRLCEVSYSNYLSGCSLELKQNPKSFWKFVNSKRKSDQFPNFMTYALNNDCFPGPDNIPEIVLKQCSRVLSKPISTLFNRSISEGTFPSCWKTSFIRPVHKKGEKKNIENYRPIAKLSSIPKVFELMVYDVIYNYCSELVVPNQHGFLKMKSTVTNLVECSSKFLNTMEAGSQTDVIYTDLSKAFDLLPHNVVLFKLEKYGFPPFFIKWIGSYLCSRKYGVIFRSCISNYFVANSGVPQGSHLGPLLFIISINDVTRVLKHSDLSIYADDMKIYRRIDSATDTLLVQRDLDSFANWCNFNNLSLNVSKCSVVSYTRRSVTITSNYVLNKANLNRVSSIKDLGVVFDEKLTFRQHYNAVISKANSVLGFVKRYTKEFNDPYVIKTLFVALVRPHLEYASQVWSPSYRDHVNRLEAVQKNFLRYALRNFHWENPIILPPYGDRLLLLQMKTLESRRIVADILFIVQVFMSRINFTYAKNIIEAQLNSVTRFRNNKIFNLPFHRTNYGKNEPISRMLVAVNKYISREELSLTKTQLKNTLFAKLH
ncbi:uncharacterized protein LOC129611940 [Condylostylus longicornis]|uniref:uncharacterized protein LOC129611940 n=1 Tax=Condylostylus longicornis TaxID=2530218 RepID=UPI00244E2BD2|nr:uncharacterized protein LOC129611940 [Condylostylus longicornis]